MIKIMDMSAGITDDIYITLASRTRMEIGDVLKTVEEIVDNVKKNGDKAVLEYTRKFDKVSLEKSLTGADIKVSEQEISQAYSKITPELIEAIKRAKANIQDFHIKQKEKSWFSDEKEGIILGMLVRPLEIVGVYVPGGTAPLISTVLMDVIPARVAGVAKIVMCTPPGSNGEINPGILVAAKEAGVDEIYKVGGAQAIAAMAFGTTTIKKVDKIVGPGNVYVNTAKRMVFGYCDIDMFAGPSEIAVIADETADASFVAADMLSQAEHDVLSSAILVTTSKELAEKVSNQIDQQLQSLDRKEIIEKSLKNYCAIVISRNLEDAIQLINQIAPEHLELCIKEPFNQIGAIRNAGAIFMGNYSPEPLGDYYAGPNHTLPTSGTARFFSPLNVGDFIKKTSMISYSKNALSDAKKDILELAGAEGLSAHANAIKVRFKENE
jgi:histidinol dehydrogenase